MNELELLSPAGDIKIFKSVVNAGADAVYFGGDLFGARAYAKNFTIEEASEAISYAHIHGAKAYLTVNTLLKNLEIEKDLYNFLKAYVESGIDAFIVQDLGVFEMIRDCFPDTAIHASTQMSLCSPYGAKLLQNAGAKRIVTAREISIDEISSIHKACPDLEIESFIHGALCVCYSGQCLMSSIIGGRSGNRGRCAQPCRLPYQVMDQNYKHISTPGEYILSPKDFCTIKSLPQMIEAGVISFKIEGRMKQISYATGVVSVYRHYLDQYLYKGAKEYKVSDADIKKLLDFGNRSGFTDLYLSKHNGPEMMTFEEPSHTKSDDVFECLKEKKIAINAKVKACLGSPFEVTFYDELDHSFSAVGNVVEAAKNKPSTREDIEKAVSGLGTTAFTLNKLNVDYDDGIFLPVSVIKNTRRQAIEGFIDKYYGQKVSKVCDFKEVKFKGNVSKTTTSPFVLVSTADQFNAVLNHDFVDKIAVPVELYNDFKALTEKELYVFLPPVVRNEYADTISIPSSALGVLVSSYDGLGLLENVNYPKDKVILDHRLYTFSNRAEAFFEDGLGYKNNCIPVELSLKELAHRDNSNSQMIIYSRLPLMITANCTIKNTKGCLKQNSLIYIKDRKDAVMPVKCNCSYCYNTIYNSKKYVAFGLKDELSNLGVKEYRIDFSVENAQEVDEILNEYENVFIKNRPFELNGDFTKGHLKRGVE